MVLWSLREVVRPTIIKRGFEDTGQYPLSFDSIMDRCYTKVNQIERDAMKATTEVDVLYFKTHGNITEEQLDRSNISTMQFHVIKDHFRTNELF